MILILLFWHFVSHMIFHWFQLNERIDINFRYINISYRIYFIQIKIMFEILKTKRKMFWYSSDFIRIIYEPVPHKNFKFVTLSEEKYLPTNKFFFIRKKCSSFTRQNQNNLSTLKSLPRFVLPSSVSMSTYWENGWISVQNTFVSSVSSNLIYPKNSRERTKNQIA